MHREHTVRREVMSIPPTRENRGVRHSSPEDAGSRRTPRYACYLDSLSWADWNILALLRYIYVNTGVPAKGGDDLRTLLRDYVEYAMSVLMNDEESKDLMVEDGGPLLGDFMEMVAKRIN